MSLSDATKIGAHLAENPLFAPRAAKLAVGLSQPIWSNRTGQSGPRPHQAARPRRAAPGKKPMNTSVLATSAIQFENLIEQSKIKFTLRNSVSPQR